MNQRVQEAVDINPSSLSQLKMYGELIDLENRRKTLTSRRERSLIDLKVWTKIEIIKQRLVDKRKLIDIAVRLRCSEAHVCRVIEYVKDKDSFVRKAQDQLEAKNLFHYQSQRRHGDRSCQR